MSSFAAVYVGIVYPRLIFPYLDHLLTPKRLRCGAAGVVVAKVLFENLVHTPLVYFPAFYAFTGVVRGQSNDEIRETAINSFLPNNVANCCLWIPASAVVFAVVPVPLRVYAWNAVSFCWNNLLGLITAQSGKGGLVDERELRIVPAGQRERFGQGTYDDKESPTTTPKKRRVEGVSEWHIKGSGAIQMELEAAGLRLDAFQRSHLRQDEITQMKAHRGHYQKFRQGAPHGVTDKATALFGGETSHDDFRREYQSFRRGAAHGCKWSRTVDIAA